MKPLNLPRFSRRERGFALIVTLSLMILLTVIAVGLLTLSSISLRASSSSSAMTEARSNARLSVLLALGQLQLNTGQDTRITASANILDSSSPSITGAWRSWEGTDHDATGKPIIPNYASKKVAGNPNGLPGVAANGRFLGWLTSATSNTAPAVDQFPDILKTAAVGYVPLVSTGSVSNPNSEVYIKPTLVNASKGALAWWTTGENSKAMINTDRTANPTNAVAWQERVRSNGRADAKSFGLESVNTIAPGTVIPSTGNLKLVNPAVDLKKIHDLTAFSRGLLTNTATGGWRKDLSLMSEKFSSLPASNLPFFTLSSGKDQTFSKAQLNSTAGNPLIYPWAQYRNNGTGQGWQQAPPICSWSALVDYTQQYTKLPGTGSAAKTTMSPTFAFGTYGDPDQRLEFQDKVRRVPQIARIQWIYSIGSSPSTTPGKFNPGIVLTPVLTLWNPYNVEVSVSNFSINMKETAPISLKLSVAGTVLPEVTLSDISRAGGGGYTYFNINIASSITLAPGATKIFSTTDKIPTVYLAAAAATVTLQLKPGYTTGGGVLFTYINKQATGDALVVEANATDSFKVDKINYNALTTDEGGKKGIGVVYDIVVNGQAVSAARMTYEPTELGGASIVNQLYPPLTNAIEKRVDAININSGGSGSSPSQPFASALFGYRMASPLSGATNLKHLLSKGMLQANPLCCYTEIGFGDDVNALTSMAGTGIYHPINAPYDFAFQELAGWNDTSAAPQWEESSGSSYIVSGLKPSDGLTRCVMAELPTRPLQSLAELQHFDARNNNPITPFQFNLIGNGSAHPIFAPNQIAIQTSKNNGMCNDDTYILNHLLFDDWFVSSITKDVRNFGSASDRTISATYQDHLTFTTPLPNRFYLPAPKADSPKLSDAVTAAMSSAKDSKTGKYQFETIASKLVVDGMFNINSISVEAWKAILRQSRDMQIPYLAATGSTTTTAAATASFAYPRTSIAGDQGSDSGSKASGSLFPAAAEFAGYRALTEDQTDELATQIVTEIKKRGPFLSLSEFVNRQLTTTKDLAIASTIQKALDNLANLGSSPKNPYAAIQAIAPNITSPPPGTTDYKFPEAALGSSAFGVPGWVRQADILKPLAPILSARDDTFTIRGYGDSREKGNPTKVVAKAWCEVVVQRQADYVDPSNPAGVAPFSNLMTSSINKRFGRRYEIVSFRWLNEKEI